MKITKHAVSCCICGSPEYRSLYADELGDSSPAVEYDFTAETRKTFAIVSCIACGHIYTNPMPMIDDVYAESEDEVYQSTRKQRIKCFEKIFDLIQNYHKSGNLLDVGCATGLLLDVVSSKFKTYGVEPSRWSRGACSKKHKVYSSLEEVDNIRFDVITMLGVIEHITDPDALMRMIVKKLNPGGVFVVYTGDVEAFLPRLLKKRWWWYQGMHLHYFSLRTLVMLMNKHGMSMVHSGNMPLYFAMSSLSTSLKRYPVLHRMASPLLELPIVRDVHLPMPLSGEMLLVARR
ncbi:class I SAM-dependent methyltransferase [Fundidesulfovibrio putealis]|uniref:class I SAM-dependent methyltransferase n=1 Tax=Fundidesulfovibrio putealis TaxID=270496 RepID=UPI000A04ECA5|nr:class I SAM-dependent methyltransferase [Fundidesulfovibrio putealis]